MRHGVKTKKWGANAQHKRAMLRSLSTSILMKGLEADPQERMVRTTLLKAKLARSVVDRLISFAKKGTAEGVAPADSLACRRHVSRFVFDPKVVKGLFDVIGPRYQSRNGGYTRVLKLGDCRPGDAAEMALVGLVEDTVATK